MGQSKWVYDFAEGSRDMRDLLGGKGANVAEMTRVLGVDRVPPGSRSRPRRASPTCARTTSPTGMKDQVAQALGRLESLSGKRFGDDSDPLLVSVRSGARESMPGMMDSILNLGLNDQAVDGLARSTGNEWFAWDSYRRLVQMFGNVAHGVPGDRIEDAIAEVKQAAGVQMDTELTVADLRELVGRFKGFYDFPQDPQEQLAQAIRAVFQSWMGDRAVSYRRINRIPDIGAPPSTCSGWCSGTWATRRPPASRSAATRSPASPSPRATSSSTPRARTWSPACGRHATCPSSPT